jgi:Domain of Unknown Function (DUF928)
MEKRMNKNVIVTALLSVAFSAAWLVPTPSPAQNPPPSPAQDEEAVATPEYKPPARGAPGGRVGGASRGTVKATMPLPTIELLAPDVSAGQTTSPTPILYFYVSQSINWRTQFTISAPLRPDPVIEVNIPTPQQAGVYAIRTADYNVQLQPGVLYTWSVSVILNPKAPSRDIVASASLLRTAPDPILESELRGAPRNRRARLFAQAGFWYDAVAAAADMEAFDRHAALDALMSEVGLVEPARFDRQTVDGRQSR